MTKREERLKAVTRTSRRRRDAEAEFHAAVLEAWYANIPIREIAKAAGYKSHGTLYQFVRKARG